jgi:hypothetical protein
MDARGAGITVSCLAAVSVACGSPREPERRDSAPSAPAGSTTAPVSMHPPILSGKGIGCARIGDSVATLRRSCNVLSDTVVQGAEGMPERLLIVRIHGASVTATPFDDVIGRIVVADSTLRTGDGLGVGSTLAELLARPGVGTIEGEGRVFVTIPAHCGLSFQLAARRDGRGGTTRDVVFAFPRATVVERVLIFGCADAQGGESA